MDYKHWCTKLTEDEFTDWEVEMLMYHAFHNNERFFTEQFGSFKSFIGNSFSWGETKKGVNYWSILGREQR